VPETGERTARLIRLLVLVSAALAAFAFGGQAAAQTAQKKELDELRGRIEALQRDLERSEGTRAEAADALRESERAISRTNQRLFQVAQQRRQLNAELGRLKQQARELEQHIDAERDRLGKLVYRQYVAGQPESLRLMLNRQDPNETARQLHYLGYISRARAELIASLRTNLDTLNTLAQRTTQKNADLRALESEEAKQKQRLVEEKADRQKVLSRASSEIARQRKEISTLKRNEQRLTQLIDRLAREAERRRKSTGLRNNQLPDASASGSAFRKLKGNLRLPVIGELMNRFGGQRQDSGLSWKGLFISARSGQEVKAIASGEVVYADWLRGFGNLLILDHGGGYMSLYGNNEALLRQVGEKLRAGDTIASVGNSGGNPDSGLYFELRHQGRPFDPMPWVKLK
jgi:murein hydrolase activator